MAGNGDAVDQRHGVAIARQAVVHLGEEGIEARRVAEFDAARIPATRLIEVRRQRDLGMACAARPDHRRRTFENRGHRHVRIGGRIDEGRVRAVLQEPPHQIGEQIAMAADRRIDAARRARRVAQQRLVERLAHAVEPLELIALDAAGDLDDGRDGEGIVGRDLRIEPRPRRQQLARAGHVAEVGHGLAGEHGVVGEPALLGALDLGIPVGALDEAHHEPASQRLRRAGHPVDHRRRALLVGLHREAEAVPAGEAGIGQSAGDDVERQFEPVGFLGVDGEVELMGLGGARQLDHPRGQLRHDPHVRYRLVARAERRKLHRYAGTLRQAWRPGRRADGGDRLGVGAEVALGVRSGAGALAQHIEGIAEFRVRSAPRQGLADGLAEHEMGAHEAHRLPRGGTHRRASEPAHQPLDNVLRGLVRGDHPGRNAERPGRSRHQQGRRTHLVVGEIPRRQLVLDEAVGGGAVGHPQQRLGQHHQREPLLGGERVLVQEVLDAADAPGPRPDRRDQGAGARIDAGLRLRLQRRGCEEPRGHVFIGGRIGRTERRDATFHRAHLLLGDDRILHVGQSCTSMVGRDKSIRLPNCRTPSEELYRTGLQSR